MILGVIVAGTVVSMLIWSGRSNDPLTVASNVPNPFGTVGTFSLRGALADIGARGGKRLVDVTFGNGETQEALAVDTLNFIVIPDGPDISHDAPLSVAVTPGKRLYGYKYSTGSASLERQRKAEADAGQPKTFPELFPGQFFASAEKRNDGSGFISGFETEYSIVFRPLEEVMLERNARYVLIVEDAGTVVAVRGLTLCGNDALEPDGLDQIPGNADDEECDEGTGNGTGCVAPYGQMCPYCTSQCRSETMTGPFCGDGRCDAMEAESPCDPPVEPPGTCGSNWIVCSADCQQAVSVCPNGRVEIDEQCDDGNVNNADGCSADPSFSPTCRIRSGYYCLGSRPSVCTPIVSPRTNACQSFQWNLKSGTALPASGRAYFGAAVHAGKMWIVGGKAWAAEASNQWIYTNEVLSSDDGIHWTVTGYLPRGIVHNALVSFGGKLWSIGGVDYASLGTTEPALYSSEDGVTWAQEQLPNQPGYFADASAVVFAGKLWVLLGRTIPSPGSPVPGSTLRNAYSFDGIAWRAEEPLPEDAQGGHAVVHGNALYVVGGGSPGPYYFLKTTYRSFDGITWQRIGGTYVQWGFDDFEDLIEWNGKIWQIGKFLDSTGSNQVVYSTDGISWITSCPLPVLGSLRGHRVLDFQGNVWILGGAKTTLSTGSTETYESMGVP